jgi:hypothetical protein
MPKKFPAEFKRDVVRDAVLAETVRHGPTSVVLRARGRQAPTTAKEVPTADVSVGNARPPR